MRFVLGLVLSLVLLSACSLYEESPVVQDLKGGMELTVGHVPVNTVCNMLTKVLASPAVKSASTRNVTVSPANVMAYNAQGELLTRAEDQEARYYLVTIPELEMYAITGAHSTVPPLLVLAEGVPQTSYLHFEDELENHVVNLPNSLE